MFSETKNSAELDDYRWMNVVCQLAGQPLPRQARDDMAAAGKDDDAARNKAIESVVRYTWMLAIRYQTRRVDAVDLFQEGMIGAMHAIYTWDPNHESSAGFQTYAGWASRQYMKKLLKQDRLIRIPMSWLDGFGHPIWEERNPELYNLPMSLDRSLVQTNNDKHPLKLRDIVADERGKQPYEDADLDELFERFHLIISRMEARRREVLIRRFEGETLEEVGKEMGICKERVRQLQKDAVEDINVFTSTPIIFTENVIV